VGICKFPFLKLEAHFENFVHLIELKRFRGAPSNQKVCLLASGCPTRRANRLPLLSLSPRRLATVVASPRGQSESRQQPRPDRFVLQGAPTALTNQRAIACRALRHCRPPRCPPPTHVSASRPPFCPHGACIYLRVPIPPVHPPRRLFPLKVSFATDFTCFATVAHRRQSHSLAPLSHAQVTKHRCTEEQLSDP
jgi:hypothetical protein